VRNIRGSPAVAGRMTSSDDASAASVHPAVRKQREALSAYFLLDFGVLCRHQAAQDTRIANRSARGVGFSAARGLDRQVGQSDRHMMGLTASSAQRTRRTAARQSANVGSGFLYQEAVRTGRFPTRPANSQAHRETREKRPRFHKAVPVATSTGWLAFPLAVFHPAMVIRVQSVVAASNRSCGLADGNR